jgi:uncharacterized paraquat-inducible protein A
MTKTIILSAALLISSFGLFAQTKPASHPSTKHQDTLYTCTMHPEVVSHKPGKCPKCGMDLVIKKSASKTDPAMHKKPMHKMDSTKSMQKMPA